MYTHPTNPYWQAKEEQEDKLDSLYNHLYYDIMDKCKTFSTRLEWLLEHLPENEQDDIYFYLEDRELFEKYVDNYVNKQIEEINSL